MLEFRPMEINDKPFADKFLKTSGNKACEYDFGCVFMWSKANKSEILVNRDVLLIRSNFKDKEFYFFPVGEDAEVKNVISDLIKIHSEEKRELKIHALENKHVEFLNANFPGEFEIKDTRESYDYIYNMTDLLNLSGKKYHGKRGHLKKFLARDNWTAEEIKAENIEECRIMGRKWCELNGCKSNYQLQRDNCAVNVALDHFDELGFVGTLIRLDGEVVAFTVGEPSDDSQMVVHIEKAYYDYQGLYQAINNEFIKMHCADFEYINREDDTGNEGLRKAKLSYYPDHLIEKSHARLKLL